jgi:TPR repeat protein
MSPVSDSDKRYNSSRGHAGAQLQLGLFFKDGTGVAPNPTEAYQWFRLAAINGLPEAQFYLGGCYELGFGVEKNSTEALSWYKKAADGGFIEAKQKLQGKL